MVPVSQSIRSAISPRIYYVNPLLLSGADRWSEAFDHAASLGFNTVLSAPPFMRVCGRGVFGPVDFDHLDPALQLEGRALNGLAALVGSARERGLDLMLDLPVNAGGVNDLSALTSLDPRASPVAPFKARGRVELEPVLEAWTKRFVEHASVGLAGYRLLDLETFGPDGVKALIALAKNANPATRCFAYTPGTDFTFRRELRGSGVDGIFSSLAWWDLRESWFLQEYRLQHGIAPQITFPEAPFVKRLAHGTDSREIRERRSLRALQLAAELGDGLLIPMGFEFGAVLPLDPLQGNGEGVKALKAQGAFDISAGVRSVNLTRRDSGPLQVIRCDSSNQVTVIAKADHADLRVAGDARLIAVNRDLRRVATLPDEILRRSASPFEPASSVVDDKRLRPGEVRAIVTEALPPIKAGRKNDADAARLPRIVIENVAPQVEDGRFPVRRVVGDVVTVEADVFADGHDLLAASLHHRPCDETEWRQAPMALVQNDRWQSRFPVKRVGRYEFRVEAWKNPFAIFRYELAKKHEARLDLHLELMEGEELLRSAISTPAAGMAEEGLAQLSNLLNEFHAASSARRIELLLAPCANELMAKADIRPFNVFSKSYLVDCERREAAFASWYQIFPRSQSGDAERHGTFDDVIARLPAIKEMGFDVLYFPPIHPIGRTNRKGRNNSLVAAPRDPGSPYAIGSDAGGHEAIHPELGGFESFDRLVDETKKVGLELALDLAIQASPDHPWLKQHPGWFEWRPDGTIRYAENPPKKYEDIVNVDFYGKDAVPDLWRELRDIVAMWVDRGVKLFRVDNPHTKPFPFWEWLIGDIRAQNPDVVFLSEAFTRPKVMYRLAKVGFSQSYTYFTWRNTRWELEQYMIEITQTNAKEFFRPHFFVNTHDINPDFLQNAPRSAYMIRAALAATLSGLWGVYNGFELCEGRPDAKHKEYADSEKYEIRAWDHDRTGNIKAEIGLLNRIRLDNAALHSHLGLTLLNSANPNVMFFEKAGPGRHNVLLIAITLNPHHAEESRVEFPLWHFGISDEGTLALEDLVSGKTFTRTGKWQSIRLDPEHLPFAIWRVRIGEA